MPDVAAPPQRFSRDETRSYRMCVNGRPRQAAFPIWAAARRANWFWLYYYSVLSNVAFWLQGIAAGGLLGQIGGRVIRVVHAMRRWGLVLAVYSKFHHWTLHAGRHGINSTSNGRHGIKVFAVVDSDYGPALDKAGSD